MALVVLLCAISSENLRAAPVLYTVTDLAALPADTDTYYYDINNSGQVVGTAAAGGYPHAFLYSNGVTQDLGTFGGTASCAYAVNDSGQVVGFALLSTGAEHPFLYTGGGQLVYPQ